MCENHTFYISRELKTEEFSKNIYKSFYLKSMHVIHGLLLGYKCNFYSFEPRHEKTNVVLNRSNTNWSVPSRTNVRCLKFWIHVDKELYYPCSKNKGADQLRLWFRICRLFSHDVAHFTFHREHIITHK